MKLLLRSVGPPLRLGLWSVSYVCPGHGTTEGQHLCASDCTSEVYCASSTQEGEAVLGRRDLVGRGSKTYHVPSPIPLPSISRELNPSVQMFVAPKELPDSLRSSPHPPASTTHVTTTWDSVDELLSFPLVSDFNLGPHIRESLNLHVKKPSTFSDIKLKLCLSFNHK